MAGASFVLSGWSFAADVASTPGPSGSSKATSASSGAPTASDVSVPLSLSSDPGAPYTVYLDFGGFSFSGNWGNNASYTPGVTPAYDTDGNTAAFSSTDLADMKIIWSRISQKYAPFNVNVTTVDPAVAAGQAGTDTARQNYYDSQPQMMHTVIGGSDTWVTAGGISFVGVTPGAQAGSNGYHTNWIFAAEAPTNFQFISDAGAHENGHGFGLSHQSDYTAATGGTLVNEYSGGIAGVVAPIMGQTYNDSPQAARGLWSQGTSDLPNGEGIQNDAKVIVNDANMGGYKTDSAGHTVATAAALPITGTTINFNSATGIITPASVSAPNPVGVANYTSDFWKFTTAGGLVNITANSGSELITPGVADQSPTLNATLELFNSSGTLLQTIDTASLSETLTTTLAGGTYEIAVLSHGGISDSTYVERDFYDMGPYFLTGTIPAAPEPVGAGILVLTMAFTTGRRMRRSAH